MPTWSSASRSAPGDHDRARASPWLPEYSARTVPNTQLIEITVTDTDPARAQAVAKELVNQLVAISPSAKTVNPKNARPSSAGN